MGFYVNEDSKGNPLPAMGKTQALIADGAVEVSDKKFLDDMICVVVNGHFEAALYVDKYEFDYLHKYPDRRPKRWFVYKDAKYISGHTPRPETNEPDDDESGYPDSGSRDRLDNYPDIADAYEDRDEYENQDHDNH